MPVFGSLLVGLILCWCIWFFVPVFGSLLVGLVLCWCIWFFVPVFGSLSPFVSVRACECARI